MSLPKINEKYYSCELPTSKVKVNFRPFTVRDQKHFLMEGENEDKVETKYKMIYEMVKACSKVPEGTIDDLYTVDFDYLFFQIRKYSVGNELEINFIYKKDAQSEDEKPIEESIQTSINIDEDLKISDITPDLLKTEMTVGDFMFTLEQPKVKDVVANYEIKEDNEGFLIASMLKQVQQGEQVYNDYLLSDAKDFLENLPPQNYEDVIDFMNKNPRLYFDKKIKVKSTDDEIDLSKFNYIDFFLSL